MPPTGGQRIGFVSDASDVLLLAVVGCDQDGEELDSAVFVGWQSERRADLVSILRRSESQRDGLGGEDRQRV